MVILTGQVVTIVVSIAMFLLVILILVSILLYAKKKLIPSGKVNVNINDGEKVLEVDQGQSLLSALTGNKIFLPSACGGGGSCGVCRAQVDSGAGTILPTETGFFTRKEQNSNWRLTCQVKVKDNIDMRIPQEVMGVKKWECTVVSNNNVATFIKEFVVQLPKGENLDFKSGGYIQIDVPKIDVDFKDMEVGDKWKDEWKELGIFDLKMSNPEPTYRAYSMANHPAEGNIIMLNIRIATPPWDREKGAFMNVNPGVCSSFVFSRNKGDKVTISGPYGEFFIKETEREMMFIGGGAGMAPMRSHLFHLFKTAKTGRKVTFWYGARSLKEVFYKEEFDKIQKEFPNFKWHLALSEPKPEDNWEGPVGFIHQVILNNYLEQHEEPEDIEYYICGPPLMNSAVTQMLYDLGVPDEMVAFDDFGS